MLESGTLGTKGNTQVLHVLQQWMDLVITSSTAARDCTVAILCRQNAKAKASRYHEHYLTITSIRLCLCCIAGE